MKEEFKYNFLDVGIIQTTLDAAIAWPKSSSVLKMNEDESKRILKEIKVGFYSFRQMPLDKRPKIILLPEFTLNDINEAYIVRLAKALGCLIISGKDFVTTYSADGQRFVENKAVVIIPENWPEVSHSYRVSKFYFGKFSFSNEELEAFRQKKYNPISYPHMYILDADRYGKIGIAICADFFDIERFVIYKGRIHHLFIVAHNKEINSFYFLAEAISRLVFCNVIICNTGFYGGSIGFSPYNQSYKRYIYKHEGNKLFTSQTISLPVRSLDEAQKKQDKNGLFKSSPPAYKQK